MSRLLSSITTAQQQICLSVSRGSHYWTAGQVRIEKYAALVEKFGEIYGTELSRGRRNYRRDKGLANADLIACDTGGLVLWWLLITDGKHPARTEESLRDARAPGQRLTFGQDYILIHSTRPKKHGGGSRWTWYLTKECEKGDARVLAKIARHGSAREINGFCETLLHRPLHSGIRSQTAKMIRRAIVIWKRHHASMPWPGPDPSSLPIMTFKVTRSSTTATREAARRKLEEAFRLMNQDSQPPDVVATHNAT